MSAMSDAADPARRPRMVLRSTLTSPYGRKVRMAAMHLGVADEIEVVPADTLDERDTLRQQNPLGKMPCLLTEAGWIFDSRTILDYLDQRAGGGRLVPAEGTGRWSALTLAALADGVTDAALLMVYEGRFREPHQRSQPWLDHQAGKVHRALAALASAPPDPGRTDVASISLACALGYLDWRQPLEWRAGHGVLADWLAAFTAAEPAFELTERPR